MRGKKLPQFSVTTKVMTGCVTILSIWITLITFQHLLTEGAYLHTTWHSLSYCCKNVNLVQSILRANKLWPGIGKSDRMDISMHCRSSTKKSAQGYILPPQSLRWTDILHTFMRSASPVQWFRFRCNNNNNYTRTCQIVQTLSIPETKSRSTISPCPSADLIQSKSLAIT